MTRALVFALLMTITYLSMKIDRVDEQNKALRFEIGLCREGKK